VTTPTVPAAQVAEVFQLLAEVVGEPRVTRAAAQVERESSVTPYVARQIAEANAAIAVRVFLAGLLSSGTGEITPGGLDWAVVWLRRELDDGGDQKAPAQ
jgi:hypothetical protein